MKRRTPQEESTIRVGTVLIVRGILLLGVAVVGRDFLTWLYPRIQNLLLMLVVSVFLCYLIAPLVRIFEQPVYVGPREIKLPRVAAIGVVYFLFAGLLFIALQLLVPVLRQQITDLSSNLPLYATSGADWVKQKMTDADSWIRQLRLPDDVRNWLVNKVTDLAQTLPQQAVGMVDVLVGSLAYVLWPILVPIFSFFMLKDGDRFAKAVVHLLPTERLQKRAYWLLLDVSGTLAAYIRAQITACLLVGAVVTIGLLIFQVPYAVVLGVISGILEFIPMVGPLTAAVLTFGLTLTTSFKMAIGVAIGFAVFRIVQDYVIYPRIVGHGIKMHPLIVVLAILAGERVGGLTGIFLAIPVVGLIIVFYNHYLAFRLTSRKEGEEGATPTEPISADAPIGP